MDNSAANSASNVIPLTLPATEHFMTPKQAAVLVGLSTRTLDRLRLTGTGPRYSRLGRRVRYTRADINAWVGERKFASTSEEDIARGR